MAAEIQLRFYEELNDYLPHEQRKREFTVRLEGPLSVARMLERVGVPASEVELILVNGVSTGFSHFLYAGDRVSIYPVFESFDVKSLLRLRKEPLRRLRFTLDPGLRRLGACLRLLGFDARIRTGAPAADDAERVLLTADAAVANCGLTRLYVVRKTRPGAQLREVILRFDLFNRVRLSHSR